MLKSLSIANLAIIENLCVEWTPGLNVLTGETGAGKSILFDALSIVLGAKAGAANIRHGAPKATIEACFATTPAILGWLKQKALLENEDSEASELIVSREISPSGSRARINGTLVTQTDLNELRQFLLTFHAQHEIRTLMNSSSQLEMIDGLGSTRHMRFKDRLRTQHAQYKELKRLLEELSVSEDERERKLDFSRYQLDELNNAKLEEANEDEELRGQLKVLSNVQKMETTLDRALGQLTGGDFGESSNARDILQSILTDLEVLSDLDPELSGSIEFVNTSLANVEEASDSLRKYRNSLDADPETLAYIEERLDTLATIKRKYGPSLADAIAKRDELDAEINKLENANEELERIAAELQEVESSLLETAEVLSEERKALAVTLEKSIVKELSDVGMERCIFKIAFSRLETVTADGLDKVEFMIAPNPGQPPQPLSKIASGGELSRIMLAIKTIFARIDKVATVVFDEIDSGLSGKVLQSMRDKLHNLARSHQILCITHQPIIASVADNFILVCKDQSNDKTVISSRSLEAEEQLTTLATMASGRDGEVALNFARSLVSEANQLKGR